MKLDKLKCFYRGELLIQKFCKLNDMDYLDVFIAQKGDWPFQACAYYRPVQIHICLDKCQYPCSEEQSRNWSYPGNVTDRTPYGVLAHELGHHCDYITGAKKYKYSSDYSKHIMDTTKEKPLTSYCPNPAEWFAEMFRLFITNPNLLKLVRPKTYELLIGDNWKPVVTNPWDKSFLGKVPERVLTACRNKIK